MQQQQMMTADGQIIQQNQEQYYEQQIDQQQAYDYGHNMPQQDIDGDGQDDIFDGRDEDEYDEDKQISPEE